jgi:hypothetical protein
MMTERKAREDLSKDTINDNKPDEFLIRDSSRSQGGARI